MSRFRATPSTIFPATRSPRRNLDKRIVNVRLATITATQQETTLLAVSIPGTLRGLRWDITVQQDGGTGGGVYAWAIVTVADGFSASALSTADGATLYAPEQEVWAYGVGGHSQATNDKALHHYNGSLKTMRKVRVGDDLVFICKGEATDTVRIDAGIQFFLQV